MTKEQVRKFFHEAGELAGWKPGMGNELVINYLTHFAALVRNAALEEAAIELKGDYTLNGEGISEVLRAMKEPTT